VLAIQGNGGQRRDSRNGQGKGPGAAVRKLIELLRAEAAKAGVEVIFAKTSSRRLFVKQEGVEP